MAKGFGEILTSAEDCKNLCDQWKHVPKGKDYLVARVERLKSICERMGDLDSQPLQLAQGIFWHSRGRIFDSCACTSNRSICDPTQELLPSVTLGHKRAPVGIFQGDLKGAAVFGRSDKFANWWWPRNSKMGPKATEARRGNRRSYYRNGFSLKCKSMLFEAVDLAPREPLWRKRRRLAETDIQRIH